MTPLEVILIVLLVISVIVNVMQARLVDYVSAGAVLAGNLYADAIAQLEKVTHERDYYKREWAARWDDWARRAGQPERHIGAGE